MGFGCLDSVSDIYDNLYVLFNVILKHTEVEPVGTQHLEAKLPSESIFSVERGISFLLSVEMFMKNFYKNNNILK